MTEDVGETPSISISEVSSSDNLLKIDLGEGHVFSGDSTTSEIRLDLPEPRFALTSQFATIDISQDNSVSSLVATLPGDDLTLGQINDLNGGIGSIAASAGTIEVAGSIPSAPTATWT